MRRRLRPVDVERAELVDVREDAVQLARIRSLPSGRRLEPGEARHVLDLLEGDPRVRHPLELLELRVLQRQALPADAREPDRGDRVGPLALQAHEQPLAVAGVAQLGAEAERPVFAGVGASTARRRRRRSERAAFSVVSSDSGISRRKRDGSPTPYPWIRRWSA